MRDALLLLFGMLFILCIAIPPVTAQTFPRIENLPEPASLSVQAGLPDPLVMMDGTMVRDRAAWERERRPELKRLFQHYMYGYMPGGPRGIKATVEREDRAYFGGKATKREVALEIGGGRTIHLLLVLPNRAPSRAPSPQPSPRRRGKGSPEAAGERGYKAPVFVGISFVGNFAVVNDPTIPVPEGWQYPNRKGVVNNRATEAGRRGAVDVWNVERTIDRGYGVALFYNGDVEPDDKNSKDGIRHRILRPGRTEIDPLDWGAVAAWAWGAQRVVDYLIKQPDVDRKRIAVVGHSRNGKAALLAGAFDERIGLVISHQSGCGGAAPSRGTVGESVKQINTSFPHWFNANFKQFNDRPDLIPFDQHALIALCAPRPVLLSNAEQDTWANPAGQFEMLKAADPIYRLFGLGGVGAETMPPMGRLLSSRLGYFIRPGEHSMKQVDWDAYLDFADSQWGKRR